MHGDFMSRTVYVLKRLYEEAKAFKKYGMRPQKSCWEGVIPPNIWLVENVRYIDAIFHTFLKSHFFFKQAGKN
jgi:hypothetical protein